MSAIESSVINKQQALSNELISINTFFNEKITNTNNKNKLMKLEFSRKAAVSEVISRYSS